MEADRPTVVGETVTRTTQTEDQDSAKDNEKDQLTVFENLDNSVTTISNQVSHIATELEGLKQCVIGLGMSSDKQHHVHMSHTQTTNTGILSTSSATPQMSHVLTYADSVKKRRKISN